MQRKSNPLSTEPYKGVRDFYPKEQFIQDYIFGVWRAAVESFGYESYHASIIEPADLYRAKSGQEIVNEQTYTFTDRGDREVTLRPEMTPTVARLVAARKRELGYPLRLYSIPNVFRYERPQRGRLREHWQLNVDMFGLSNINADIELIELSSHIMKSFGASEADYVIKISSRRLLNSLFNDWYELDANQAHALQKLIDRKNKMPEETFYAEAEQITGKAFSFLNFEGHDDTLSQILAFPNIKSAYDELKSVISTLHARGIKNVEFDQTLIRGFDYYTGIVFEVFDTHPENNRSLFGGGRFDDLLSLFDAESTPACGFGMGDVTIADFLETRNLIPEYTPATDIMICAMPANTVRNSEDENIDATQGTQSEITTACASLAQDLRSQGVNIAVNYSGKNIGDQLKNAGKLSIRYAIVIGENELQTKAYVAKDLVDGKELPLESVLAIILNK